MIFLGQASNYSFTRALRHLLTRGRPKHSKALRVALAQKYRVGKLDSGAARYGLTASGMMCEDAPDRVALYHTGRSALSAAINAVAPKGTQVIIPGLTCIAVVRAVRAAGCEPIFADIDRQTLQYDLKSLTQQLKEHKDVSAIILQNTLGISSDITGIEKLAKARHIQLIEDLAHCAGRFYPDGREMGTVGAAVALSFGKGKAIDTISGGALILRDPHYVMPNSPAIMPSKGDMRRDRWYPVLGGVMRFGYHFHLGKIFTGIFLKFRWIARSADAVLDLDLKLPHWQAKLALRQLDHLPKTVLREHALVRNRAEFLTDLSRNGYKLDEIWYDTPVSPSRAKKEAAFPAKSCPNTVKIAKEIINLPTWYPPAKLVYARELINEYEIEEEDDG